MITPDAISPWLLLVGSALTGLVAMGVLSYGKILQARLDARTRQAIHAANMAAIRSGRVDVPWPAFLPKSNIAAVAKDEP